MQAALSGPDTAFAERMAIQTNRGYGRVETRTIRVASAEGIDFPHATQIFRLRRDRAGLDGVRTSKEIVYGITSLPDDLAGPVQPPESYANPASPTSQKPYVTTPATTSDR